METRKDSLTGLKLCRFCLSQDETLTSLYDRSRAPKNSVPLSLKILSCVSIEVFPSDRMPSYICNRCKFFMDLSYEFKQMCRQADENVLQFIQTGTDLNSVTWPSSLQKFFRVATKSAPELSVMKTIVEGGATVQVSANGSDSEEEDDENVYNVKIGDESDEVPKNARVKVITNKQNNAKDKEDKDSEEESDYTPQSLEATRSLWETPNEELNVADDTVPELRNGPWSCDECDCTYPLEQLLNLHKTHKHRQRNVQCNQCDAKFYNHYDLGTHQLRHASEELLFQCIVCSKKFKRLILLKRHEKLVHADLAQLSCSACPATFISQEELNAHSEKHILAKERRFVCDICDKRFHDNSTLQRHRANLHDKEAALACLYCPARFSTVSKLTRHVRGHAGERSYPCKYCEKSFIKSHHYTRHLRSKHRHTYLSARGPFGDNTEQYRCEQCDDAFSTQDELIYHSAIHATQNLICPLCQEKFEDVDAVTAHIKSHVNGTEFMCDLCELVFTTKEKLDNHINNAHEEELRSEGQDESSVEMEVEDDEDDAAINLKEEDDHMVVEINKPDDFMLSNSQGDDMKVEHTNSEDSDSELTFTDLATVDTLGIAKTDAVKTVPEKPVAAIPGGAVITKRIATPEKRVPKSNNQTAPILRRAEEVKRNAPPVVEPSQQKKSTKTESNNTGASDKSLRLLEKELQELKRTNTRNEKTPAKPTETLRSRRPQIHTSTPKLRTSAVEEKKSQSTKSPAVEKKQSERKKENKEPKEAKETKGNNGNAKDELKEKEKEIKEKEKEVKEKEKEVKEKEKEVKEKEKEVKEKEKEIKEKDKEIKEKEKDVKEKDTPKNVIKNGTTEKSAVEEGVRRSTRPSKIKDYAKLIRDRSQDTDEDDDSDDVDEEYKETEKSIEKPKPRRSSVKPAPRGAAPAPATPAPRKRGRPRKDALKMTPTPNKVRREDKAEEVKSEENENKPKENETPVRTANEKTAAADRGSPDKESKSPCDEEPASGVLVSPTGQTLKKVPIKALPPGVKPLPLPINARPVASGEVSEMQIGKKMVKVQKIVMTKAEVEAMAKKGLLEMKDGTMVLKQGIKFSPSDPTALKSLVGDEESATKESPSKIDKAAPTRCNIEEDS